MCIGEWWRLGARPFPLGSLSFGKTLQASERVPFVVVQGLGSGDLAEDLVSIQPQLLEGNERCRCAGCQAGGGGGDRGTPGYLEAGELPPSTPAYQGGGACGLPSSPSPSCTSHASHLPVVPEGEVVSVGCLPWHSSTLASSLFLSVFRFMASQDSP